jgi:hypothetical protein
MISIIECRRKTKTEKIKGAVMREILSVRYSSGGDISCEG